ncbi:MAG: acetylesterase [Bacteroidetes bacterium HGW-Bacteroidetes-22]|nr:MAG: acetylesterase [Bacteroidetes bacterium HGW-Bacteroidetes-22]
MILRGNLFSQKLEMETSITILAPDHQSNQPHRIVYLLHGLCGRSGDWIDYTMLPNYAGAYNTIFIMPEVARSFYSDMKFGLNYFSYITDELPQICRSNFNLSGDRENTAIIGASMGGYGALKCALSRTDLYGMCCSFSAPCLFLKEDLQRSEGVLNFKELYGESLLRDFQAVFGENIPWSPKDDVVELAGRKKGNAEKLKVYLACGTDDYLYHDNLRYSYILKDLQFDINFEEWKGNHNWYFFDEALKRSLDFCFSGKP